MTTITANPIIYDNTPERPVTREGIERLQAACLAALAALSQNATHPADIALARRVLSEAIYAEPEGIAWALRRRSTND